MNLSLITSMILTFTLFLSQVEYKQLIGSWQLVHFEGMEKIVKSPQYQNANALEKAGMDAGLITVWKTQSISS
ncbi:hypothetical protein [Algoriphagus boritolerans]|uniref:hypothetical protein n=1 Tax=Algoriphagus boritolerans TaxID=308111 RepID=UPI000B25E2BE